MKRWGDNYCMFSNHYSCLPAWRSGQLHQQRSYLQRGKHEEAISQIQKEALKGTQMKALLIFDVFITLMATFFNLVGNMTISVGLAGLIIVLTGGWLVKWID